MAALPRIPSTPVTPSPQRFESQRKLDLSTSTPSGPALSPAVSIASAPPGYVEATPTPATDGPLAAAYNAQRFLLSQGTGHGIPFPFFAVVGGQSAGKSSVLTALLKVVLYTGSGTCTRGPTLIHSSHRASDSFSAAISIEVKRPHADGQSLQNFTSDSIKERDELAKALQWAGDQARRMRDGRVAIIPYEKIRSMSPGTLADINAGLPDFTDNVVKLDISGPEQVDCVIVDLPGLVGQDLYLDGLVEEYISKPECTVLLCVSAGGTDPSLANREIKLVRTHRPDGRGVVGLITKADQICLVDDDPYVQLMRGNYKEMAVFRPEHGWHPLRLRRPDEADDSDDLVRFNQRRFFASAKWSKLANDLGRSFGVESAAALLDQLNRKAVLAIRGRQDALVRQNLDNAVAELSRLPPVVEAPAEVTHDLIDSLAATLRERIVGQAVGSNPLVRPQHCLLGDLAGAIPEFLPFREQDDELSELYESPRLPWGILATAAVDGTPQVEPIYSNVLLDVIKTSTLDRCGTVDGNAIRMTFRKPVTDRWRTLCLAHIGSVWEEVAAQVTAALGDICADRPELSTRISSILLNGQQCFIKETEDLVSQLCECEAFNPSLIDVRDGCAARLSNELFDHFARECLKLYSDENADSSARAHRDGPGDDHDDKGAVAGLRFLSKDHQRMTLRFMAEISIQLAEGSRRLGSDAGRHTQLKVLAFLKDVPRLLRAGLGLNDVGGGTTHSLKRLHEPSEEVVRKRTKLLEERRRLSDLARQIGCNDDLRGSDV